MIYLKFKSYTTIVINIERHRLAINPKKVLQPMILSIKKQALDIYGLTTHMERIETKLVRKVGLINSLRH